MKRAFTVSVTNATVVQLQRSQPFHVLSMWAPTGAIWTITGPDGALRWTGTVGAFVVPVDQTWTNAWSLSHNGGAPIVITLYGEDKKEC